MQQVSLRTVVAGRALSESPFVLCTLNRALAVSSRPRYSTRGCVLIQLLAMCLSRACVPVLPLARTRQSGGWRRVPLRCLVDPVEDLVLGEHTGGHEEPYGVVADEAREGDQSLQQ